MTVVNKNPEYFLTIASERSVSKAAGKLRLHKSVLYRKLEKYRSQAAITLPAR